MDGRVLGFDDADKTGVIVAEDGRRYPFAAGEWRQRVPPQPGQIVDFEVDPDSGQARAIYLLFGGTAMTADKSRITAALLALLLGTLGIHKFYLGKITAGAIMLACGTVGWFLVLPGVVVLLVALIEGVTYLATPEEAFQRKYVEGATSWF